MKSLLTLFIAGLFPALAFSQESEKPKTESKPSKAKSSEVTVVMSTSMGDIHIELDSKRSPKTVANFLQYVDAKFYDGTVFHRVIGNFMIQGGGFELKDDKLSKKATKAPIKNESKKSGPNVRGSIAMARLPDPHSATSQFFINVVDNAGLNYPNNGGGYATFGKVVKGMEIVDKIRGVKTGFSQGMGDVPKVPVVINSVKRAK